MICYYFYKNLHLMFVLFVLLALVFIYFFYFLYFTLKNKLKQSLITQTKQQIPQLLVKDVFIFVL